MKNWIRVCVIVMLAALAAALLGGCYFIGGNGYVGNGEIVTEERDIAQALTGVVNTTSFQVVIDPELEGKAVIEGESNLVGLVELNQGDDGVLYVEVVPDTNIVSMQQMTVRVPAINGGEIRLEGSGNITLEGDKLTGDNFDVRISGSGDVSLELETGTLDLSISGSGDMNIVAAADTAEANISGSGQMDLEGSAGQLGVTITGSGHFEGFDFLVSDANVNISGSGDVNVSLSGELTGGISGSGNILFEGSPENVQVDITGSGSVRSK